MKIHLELYDAEGLLRIHDAVFESLLLSVGGEAEVDDFVIDGLPARAIEITVDGRALVIATRASQQRIESVVEIPLASGRLRITPYPPAALARDGQCPRCASSGLRDVAVGGAYRAMARRERDCERCGGSLLDLEGAETAIGAFADASKHDWVHVEAPITCPRCRAPMTRAVFSTSHARAQVERCVPCGLVFLESADRARLRGDAR